MHDVGGYHVNFYGFELPVAIWVQQSRRGTIRLVVEYSVSSLSISFSEFFPEACFVTFFFFVF